MVPKRNDGDQINMKHKFSILKFCYFWKKLKWVHIKIISCSFKKTTKVTENTNKTKQSEYFFDLEAKRLCRWFRVHCHDEKYLKEVKIEIICCLFKKNWRWPNGSKPQQQYFVIVDKNNNLKEINYGRICCSFKNYDDQ